jgi:hypothetical protein
MEPELQYKNAITSYGFILLQKKANDFNVLLIRRRYSIGFTAFIIGKYQIDDYKFLNHLFQIMTQEEKHFLLSESFHTLWERIWFLPESPCLQKKFRIAYEQFELVKQGYVNNLGQMIVLHDLIQNNNSIWSEPDWGLPKGRKDKNENALACAIRELQEETGIDAFQFVHLDKIYPLYEKYIGSDGFLYKHVYYVGILNENIIPKIDNNNQYQMAEIGDIKICSFQEAIESMRTNKRYKSKMFEKLIDIIKIKYPEII